MSIIDTIDAFDKLESNDLRSFAAASALIAKAIQEFNDDPSTGLNLLYENESSELTLQQKNIEREWLENNNEIISFTTILDYCLGQSLSDRPKIPEQSLYLPFRTDQPMEYEPIQWQPDLPATSRFIVQPPSPSHVLQPRNETNADQQTNINNNTNVIVLDDNDEQNYVDANGDEENEAPKPTKKKGKKKKQQAKVVENTNDASIQLNTSSNRTSTTGQKTQQKLSSKWSAGKRISGFGTGKTSAIRKFARPSNDRPNRPDSRTLFRNKPSVTGNSSRLSQEQRDQAARAADERKQEERKRKVEKLHEQAKKREEVLNRAKQIQQDKEQKNQLRISDNQSKTAAAMPNKKGQGNTFNTSTTFNNSMNESTNLPKTNIQQPQLHKPVILDTTSNKILGQNKPFKQPATIGLKKPTGLANAEYTFVVDKNTTQRNDITLPSSSLAQPSAQHKADWTILPTPTNAYDELELDATMTDTTRDSADGDYGIEDVRSDQDSDNDDEDETRIPGWAKERLFQTFWKTQGHWYLSRRTLKLTRRTLGHYPIIKDELQTWLKELKSSKPLSETFTDATYLDQTQAPHFF